MHFPYKARKNQNYIIKDMEDTFEQGKHLVMEAVTGSGKTVCALYSAINSAKKNGKKILYLTRTNAQQERVLEEMKNFQDEFGNPLQDTFYFAPNPEFGFEYDTLFFFAPDDGVLEPPETLIVKIDESYNYENIFNDSIIIFLSDSLLTTTNKTFDNPFIIYPNPAKDILYISSSKLEGKIISIIFYNAIGHPVKTIKGRSAGNRIAIDLTDMDRGAYFIKIECKDYSKVERLVIEK